MKFLLSIFIFLALVNCTNRQVASEKSINNASIQNETVSVTNSKVETSLVQIEELPAVLQKIENQIPKISLNETFELNKESDDKLDNHYLKLASSMIDYFYATDKLQRYHEYFNFVSCFYGYHQSQTGLTKVFILNTNYETAIYLDCFILDGTGKISAYFSPSFIEIQPSYCILGSGSFKNDSVYSLINTDLEIIDEPGGISVKDSSVVSYEISRTGSIKISTIKFDPDTIYGTN